MKFDSRFQELRTLPLHSNGAANGRMLDGNQPLELERRREFVRAYLANDRADGNGQKLDPVLASHLGLTEEKRGQGPDARGQLKAERT